MRRRLLIVDDEETIRLALSEALKSSHDVNQASDGEAAVEMLGQASYDLVLSDLRMGRLGGLDVLRAAKDLNPRCLVMILTAYGSIDNAVDAMKAGADDYLTKPFSLEEVEHKVAALLERQKLSEERDYLRSELAGQGAFLGDSEAFRELKRRMAQAGPSPSAVLLRGEMGSGKESAARALHEASGRSKGPFVAMKCAALKPELAEAELFGNEKGAFSGALSQRRGRLELADAGTLYLDEIAELPAESQAKLLRALEEGSFQRLGGSHGLSSDFRLICSTRHDLQALVAEHKFNQDLYFRLAVLVLNVPPLRERGEDVVQLAEAFLQQKAPGRSLKFPEHAARILKSYAWPGNVRELQNVIERAALLSSGHILRLDLALEDKDDSGVIPRSPLQSGKNLDAMLDEAEASLVAEAMRKAEGKQTQAAKILGIERSTLQYKLKKYKLG